MNDIFKILLYPVLYIIDIYYPGMTNSFTTFEGNKNIHNDCTPSTLCTHIHYTSYLCSVHIT